MSHHRRAEPASEQAFIASGRVEMPNDGFVFDGTVGGGAGPEPASSQSGSTVDHKAPLDPQPPVVWKLFADELYFQCHHDGYGDGRPRMAEPAVRLGLAGALLVELTWHQWIRLHDELVIVQRSGPPPDLTAHEVMDHIRGEPKPLPVWAWLKFLSAMSLEMIAKRLERRGLLQQEQRGWLRREMRYVPVDNNYAAWANARLVAAYRRGFDFGLTDLVQISLVTATGFHREVFYDVPAERLDTLTTWANDGTPEQVRSLIQMIQASAGNAVMAPR